MILQKIIFPILTSIKLKIARSYRCLHLTPRESTRYPYHRFHRMICAILSLASRNPFQNINKYENAANYISNVDPRKLKTSEPITNIATGAGFQGS